MKTIILPKCMMPDGAEPCEGYKQLQAKIDEAWSAGHLSATTEDVELMDAMEAKHKAEIEELVDMLEEMLYSNSTKYREKASELIDKHKGE